MNEKFYWTVEQASRGVAQFDKAMVDSCPVSKAYVYDAHKYLETVGEACNYIAASERISWGNYLNKNAKVMDFGCGGGWMAAMLSRLDPVKTVYALDSSRHFLHTIMPKVIELMNGRPEKVVPIEGLFQPILFEDAHLDVVVASSALHHADSLEPLLKEIRRVLKQGGYLFVLNETPRASYRYMISVAAAAFRILRNLLFRRYYAMSPAVSSSGYLYDPKLGDRDYPRWYWERALAVSGFSIESVMDTGLPTLKGRKGRPLIHFICRGV